MDKQKPNRLIQEKSPYLLQHAHNPVNWFPWEKEAFSKAQAENKPVFLSIGYSTCHWCHVMEKESFEDREIASILNRAFVSIKIDREERPDLDHIYMKFCQLMTGKGGWPLTLLLTPDKKPFFAGTYFPKQSRFGLPGIKDILVQIEILWKNRKDEIVDQAGKILKKLQESDEIKKDIPSFESLIETAYNQLAQSFDPEYGGFSIAPKFPSPSNLFFLLRYWKRTKNAAALRMVEKTLQAMRSGGIFDQIGYGFHRYSTDREWLIPHFEKMLYDQGLCILAYTEAFQATGKSEYAKTAMETIDYVLRDMTSLEGAFHSAEDADSEEEEGKFYLWKWQEIQNILPKQEFEPCVKIFNIRKEGNFIDPSTGQVSGTNILHILKPLKRIAEDLKIEFQSLNQSLIKIREKLSVIRDQRIRPFKDDKILVDWNGLTIAALAKASRALNIPEYSRKAEAAAAFILENMKRTGGGLFHRFRDCHSSIEGFSSDYAFLTWGLIELYETTFKPKFLEEAINLSEFLINHFWNDENGLFMTEKPYESLNTRPREVSDGAVPSANAVGMLNFLKLSRMTGRIDFEDKAKKIGQILSRETASFPAASTHLMCALSFILGPSHEVVIAGIPGIRETEDMLQTFHGHFLPHAVLLFVPRNETRPRLFQLAPFTSKLSESSKRTTAYVCSNFSCQKPTTDIKKMLALLGENFESS